jgi:periplasmic divalent cation tolerance protein
MSSVRIVLSTIDTEEHAEQIAKVLVGERLAACVSFFPRVNSVYRWEGSIVQESETLMIIKTTSDKVAGLVTKVKELHPYDVPEVISLTVETGYQPYLDWVLAECRS